MTTMRAGGLHKVTEIGKEGPCHAGPETILCFESSEEKYTVLKGINITFYTVSLLLCFICLCRFVLFTEIQRLSS